LITLFIHYLSCASRANTYQRSLMVFFQKSENPARTLSYQVYTLTVYLLLSGLKRELSELDDGKDLHKFRSVYLVLRQSLPWFYLIEWNMYTKRKIFAVNGTIEPQDYGKYFVMDQEVENKLFVGHVLRGDFVSYHAPRASGKSTRMLQLGEQLQRGILNANRVERFKCF